MTAWPSIHLGRPSPARLGQLLADARRAEPTADGAGATLSPSRGPVSEPGLELDLDVTRTVGHGTETYERAVASLRRLDPQRSVATIHPPNATADEGATLLVVLPFGPLTVVAPNRIVAVVDEPRRWGFAYGTLPGHPEVGEESFAVEHRADDAVVVRIAARAHVAVPGGRALQRVLVPVQRRFARRYLDAVEAATRSIAATDRTDDTDDTDDTDPTDEGTSP